MSLPYYMDHILWPNSLLLTKYSPVTNLHASAHHKLTEEPRERRLTFSGGRRRRQRPRGRPAAAVASAPQRPARPRRRHLRTPLPRMSATASPQPRTAWRKEGRGEPPWDQKGPNPDRKKFVWAPGEGHGVVRREDPDGAHAAPAAGHGSPGNGWEGGGRGGAVPLTLLPRCGLAGRRWKTTLMGRVGGFAAQILFEPGIQAPCGPNSLFWCPILLSSKKKLSFKD